MRKIFLTLILTLFPYLYTSAAEPVYEEYFTDSRLRIDLILAGNADSQQIYLAGLREECGWAGSPNSLIDPFRYGEYMLEAWSGDTLIYSRGLSTLFQEWRTTAEAGKVSKAFTQTVWMPYPKHSIRISLSERIKATGEFREIFSCSIDPEDELISREAGTGAEVTPLLVSGDMRHKVDLLFVAEGYTAGEMDKFHKDCTRFMEYLFSMEPYKSRKSDFNITAVDVISEDSGTDIPSRNIWKRTAMDSHFDTFYIERYLTMPDHKAIADCVSEVPFDALFIIANESKYGGGGIYNSYGLGTSDDSQALQVFIHEFGHSFAGLGDEYFDSEVAYEDFYNLKVEPWEPNITTLVDFGSKWQDMMDSGDWDKESVGLYEGGGYMSEGVFRPRDNCRMRSNGAEDFCPVCRRAISRMIDYYCR